MAANSSDHVSCGDDAVLFTLQCRSALQAVLLGKSLRVDGAADDVQLARGNVVMAQEVAAHHVAVDDDERRRLIAQVLPALEQAVRPVGDIEPFDAARAGCRGSDS